MIVKDGIILGIGFTIGQVLVNDLTSIGVNFVYPKLYREMKKVNPKFARYMNQICPCEEHDNENHSELKAKIGFEI